MAFQSGNPDETFLTVAEVAEMLKLNPQTVRNWIDQGRMPALRVGRRVRIRRSDLERVLDESATAPQSGSRDAGPPAEGFWEGEPIGVAEPVNALAEGADTETAAERESPTGSLDPTRAASAGGVG
jgi:excisionase family DNA binding protein